jgi:hypothetical protein
MSGKVMFRGDSRHPTNDDIFTDGFDKWEPGYADPVYRSAGPNMSGDLDPDSGVCVSVRFQGAALFPLKFDNTNPRINTFIYAVYVDTDDLFNTHQQQVIDALGHKSGGKWVNPDSHKNAVWSTDSPMWPLFAHEMAVNSIPAGHVIAAVPCVRHWNGSDWSFGGSYTLGAVLDNPGCNAPEPFLTLAREFLTGEVTNHSNSPMPGGDSGFHISAHV